MEILATRNGLGLAVMVTLLVLRPELRPLVRSRRPALTLFRNTIHLGAQYLWAMSVLLLPLATVFALEFSAPAWALLLAVPVLGERLTASRVGAVVLGLIGVLVILRPGLETFRPETLLVLAAAVGFAVTMITTKKLTMTDSTFAIIFWMNMIQLPLTLVPSDPLFVMKLSLAQLPAFAAVGVAGLASHYCLANAFRAGRCERGGAARFPAYSADRGHRLVALRRGAGCPRLHRCRPDHRGGVVEFAERGAAAGHSARRSAGPGGRGSQVRSALAAKLLVWEPEMGAFTLWTPLQRLIPGCGLRVGLPFHD